MRQSAVNTVTIITAATVTRGTPMANGRELWIIVAEKK